MKQQPTAVWRMGSENYVRGGIAVGKAGGKLEGGMGRCLNLVLQVFRHEAARAIHSYCVTHTDVYSMVCVIEFFYGTGIVLRNDKSNFQGQIKGAMCSE